eukprot:scaffold148542_cov22-Tisochrysis_lutea.AAC.2
MSSQCWATASCLRNGQAVNDGGSLHGALSATHACMHVPSSLPEKRIVLHYALDLHVMED